MSIGTSIVDPIQKDNYNWLGVMDFIQVNLNILIRVNIKKIH